jgi:hypothetical protein
MIHEFTLVLGRGPTGAELGRWPQRAGPDLHRGPVPGTGTFPSTDGPTLEQTVHVWRAEQADLEWCRCGTKTP